MTDDIEKQIEDLKKQVDELEDLGKYNDALPFAQRAYDLAKEHLGEEHPDYARCLISLGNAYDLAGNYPLAELYLLLAMETIGKVQGEEHPDFAKSLIFLGLVCTNMAKFHSAEQYFIHAVEIIRKVQGEEHPDFATSLNNLGILYQRIGNFPAAERYYNQSMKIYRKALGEEHPHFAAGLLNLGILYKKMGNYPAAELFYKQSMEIWSKALGEKHPHFAASLINLAILYTEMGNYPAAELYYKRAMEISRQALGEEHPTFALSLSYLGTLHWHNGDYIKAEFYYERAKEILCKVLGVEHPDYARNLNNLGFAYRNMGNYSSAELCQKQALEIWRKVLGEEHLDFAESLNDLGSLHSDMGIYSDAESLLKQAIAIRLKVLGEKHPHVADTLIELARLYPAIDQVDEAYRFIDQASGIYDYLISQIFSFGSESQRMEYLKTIQPGFDIQLSIVNKYFGDSLNKIKSTHDLILRRKAIGAEALAAQRDAVLGGKYPELNDSLSELTMLRMQIAMKEFKGPGPEGKEYHDKLIKEWTEKKEKLESELVRQIPEMSMEEKLRQADRKAVSKALPGGSVLIEFVKFNEYDFKAIPAKGEKHWKPARYLAFVLPSGEPDNVRMIDLGEADVIDKLIDDFRTSILEDYDEPARSSDKSKLQTDKNADVDISAPSGNILREAIFDKFADSLKGYKTILIAPDGNISRLPFEALPTKGRKYLIDDYQISYLSVGRDVLRFGAESSGTPIGALVAADPDFDMGSVEPIKPEETDLGFSIVKGWRKSRDFDRTSMSFDRLPGTRQESEKVSDFLKTEPWLDDHVLEGKLKTIHSPLIMHLATHGFFLEDQKINLEKESGQRYENPLLRSGLAMAGANTFIKGETLPDEAEDGILTAEDVSGLDLLGTELVVLSACDTGLGEVRTGEGVFGLRRSFMLAGTKTLVMSLWKVPDLATPILMERFYNNLINRGLGRSESLREAQVYVRDITVGKIRGKWLTDEMIDKLSCGNAESRIDLEELSLQPDGFTPFKDPVYWGAFICQGDPSSITFKNLTK